MAQLRFSEGAENVCVGKTVQLNYDGVVPSGFNYRWTAIVDENNDGIFDEIQFELRLDNNQFPILDGGGGLGEKFSFVRFSASKSMLISTYPPGGAAAITQLVVVNILPNTGSRKAPVYLCLEASDFNLFSKLDGDPDIGGKWTYNGQPYIGDEYVLGSSLPGTYAYVFESDGVCPTVSTSVKVQECNNPDLDGDGVLNGPDLDDDNDGILDAAENSFCTDAQLTPTRYSVNEDFGIGPSTRNDFVSPKLSYESGLPQDDDGGFGEYNVATSLYLYTSDGYNADFMATEANVANPHGDADGNINGRFLALNIEENLFRGSEVDRTIFEYSDLVITPGVLNTLSMQVVNFNGASSGQASPKLVIQVLDQNGLLLAERVTGEIVGNNDIWEPFSVEFTPLDTVSSVTLRILNDIDADVRGNDFGIDNILLSLFECDFDGDGIPNNLDLDSDNDGIYDSVEIGVQLGLLKDDFDADGQLAPRISDGQRVNPVNGVPWRANNGLGFTRADIDALTYSDSFLNEDSDGDTCTDANEAYGEPDADGGDGNSYGEEPYDPADIVDLNGSVIGASYEYPKNADFTSTGNTDLDFIQVGGPNACEDRDNDQDLVNDDIDLDDDNDGILDTNEYPVGITDDPLSDSNGTLLYLDTTNASFIDVNNDGVDDRFDFDLDGIINQFDVDSDNDGIYDHVEAGLALVVITDDYGQIGEDVDVEDTDITRLGLLADAPLTPGDFDNDGLPNFLDIDADGDGILDNYEAQPTNAYSAPSGIDADENGADDAYDNTGAINPEETTTGTADYLNENSDGDCMSDTVEAYDANQNGEDDDIAPGIDSNSDGLADGYDAVSSILIAGFPNIHNPETIAVDYREEFLAIEEDLVADAACNNDTALPINLFDQLIDLVAEVDDIDDLYVNLGVWTATTGTATITNGVIEPSVMDAGAYVFEYVISYPSITADNCEHTYTVALEILEEPYVGEDALIDGPTVCKTDVMEGISPFASIVASAAIPADVSIEGTWTVSAGDATAVALPTTPEDYDQEIQINTLLLAEGDIITLTYTAVNGTDADCVASIDVSIEVSAGRNAGEDKSLGSFCGNENVDTDLYVELGGVDEDGNWVATLDTGAGANTIALGANPNILNPSELLVNFGAGIYEYVYTLDPTPDGCLGDTVTIDFEILEIPYVGEDALIDGPTVCKTDLMEGISPFASIVAVAAIPADVSVEGTWTVSASNATAVTLPTTPEDYDQEMQIDTSLLAEGDIITLRYTVGNASVVDCVASIDVSIEVSAGRNAGEDKSLGSFCGSENVDTDLYVELGGVDEDGNWVATLDTGAGANTIALGANPNILNPSELVVNFGAGIYEYVYTLGATPDGCLGDTVTIDFEILEIPNAGTLINTEDVCFSEREITLANYLGGTPDTTGVWLYADDTEIGDYATATVDTEDIASGDEFTYKVGTDDCFVEAIVIINVIESPNPGVQNGSVVACGSSSAGIDLLSFLDGAQTGGTWSVGNGTVIPSSLTAGDYEYTYTLTGINGCPDAESKVAFTVTPALVALMTQTDDILCREANGQVDLSTYLDPSSTSGGTWSGGVVTAAGILDYDTAAAEERYVYTVEPAVAGGCTPVSAFIDLKLTEDRDAGGDPVNPVVVSTISSAIDLFSALNTTETDGSWTGATDNGHLGTLIPSAILPGDYTFTYTLPAPAGSTCIDDDATVTLTVLAAPVFNFDAPVCTADRLTYDVAYTVNDSADWDISFAVINGGSPGNTTINTVSSTILNIPSGTEIQLIVTDKLTGGTAVNENFLVPLSNCPCDFIAEPTNPSDITICEGEINPPLSVTLPAGQIANWYVNEDDTIDNADALYSGVDSYTRPTGDAGGHSYYVRAYDPVSRCESLDYATVQFFINGIQDVELPTQEFLCTDASGNTLPGAFATIDSEGSSLNYDFQWYNNNIAIPGETGPSIDAVEAGTYYVMLIDNNGVGIGCEKPSSSTVVTPIVEPKIQDLSLGAVGFSEFNSITATLENGGDPNSEYEYDLDGDIYQESNVFENVSTGYHTVTVTDLNSCGTDSEEIYVIGFPKFFSPNGDGTNEFWNVDLDPNEPMDLNIFVYDRFGKLIQQVFPTKNGWDGTFAGKNMPSDDYWFIATMNDSGETYASHFTLLR